MFRLLAHKPYGSIVNDLSTTPITTAAWAVLSASLPFSACAVELFNPTGSTIRISTGAAGQEASAIVPYTILPGGSTILLPQEFAKGARLSAKAVDTDAVAGLFTMNFFG